MENSERMRKQLKKICCKKIKNTNCIFCFLPLFFLFTVSVQTAAFASSKINQIRLVATCNLDDDENKLSYPTTIAYDISHDEIVLTDAGNGQLVIYNNELFPVDSLGNGRGLQSITSCLPHQDGLYITCASTEQGDGYIALVNKAFIVEKIIRPGELNPQLGKFTATRIIAGTNGRFYVLCLENTTISVFDRNWHYLHEIVPKDEILGIPEPAPIQSLDRDRNGNLYFLSEERGRVFIYDQNEKFLFKFGEKGGAERKLARPRGLAVDDRNNRILIVDYLRHAMSAYTLKGDYLFELGGKGDRPGWLLYPTDVCVDIHGKIYIADTFNHRIQVFSVSSETVQK